MFLNLLLLVTSVATAQQQPADPLADAQTTCILNYLSSLPGLSTNKVLSGQMTDHRNSTYHTPQSEYDSVITSVYNLTGKYTALAGTDYMRIFWPSPLLKNMIITNQPMITHFKNGGLISVMSSLNNPWNGGNSNNTTGAANLLDLMNSSTGAYTAFHKDLDSIAKGFKNLQDSGVTVLFRPFHENNGGWFWWGYKPTHSQNDFITMWQYVFNYMTQVKQLHNILWVFSPSVKETNDNIQDELYYYPGDNYVDIFGLDIYNDTLDIPNYNSIIATGKPFAIAEFGPDASALVQHTYNYTTLINQIRTKYPAVVYWMSWNHFTGNNGSKYFSLITQNNVDDLLNDNWVLTQDEIDYSGCNTTGINFSETTNSFTVFPNPAADNFTVETTESGSFIFRNVIGETLYIAQIQHKAVINLQQLASGIYFLSEINSGKTVKVIKE